MAPVQSCHAEAIKVCIDPSKDDEYASANGIAWIVLTSRDLLVAALEWVVQVFASACMASTLSWGGVADYRAARVAGADRAKRPSSPRWASSSPDSWTLPLQP